MTLLKKNIWLLFTVLLVSGVVLLASLSVTRWRGLVEHYGYNQYALTQHWYGSFSAILEQQEGIITLLGKDLLLRQRDKGQSVQSELNSIMALNPEVFAGFALISPAGEVLALTSNLESPNLPNLLQLPQTRDSFLYAMKSDKMVLGRTYFGPRLVIPARKAIYDNQGQVLGVMTGALNLSKTGGFFGRSQVLGPFHSITVLRTRDHYVQYAGNGSMLDDFYEQPLSDEAYQALMDTLATAAGSLEAAIMAADGVHYIRDTTDGRGTVRGIAIYSPRYEFWLISEIEESYLLKQFLQVFAGYLIIMLAFQTGMYVLFRFIDRTQKEQRSLLEFQARHDPLTQLPNRNYLLSEFSRWQQNKDRFSLLFVDLDNFKGINDSFGHSMGDRILVTLAERFRALISPDDLLVRHGGDEFVLLICGESLEDEENVITQKLYLACEDIEVQGMTFSPGASVGIARFPEHGSNLEELLRSSDIAMYEAKKSRNRVCMFQPELEGDYLYRMQIEHLLRGACRRGEICMNYQPQVDASGGLWGVEALVRWHSPELGFVPPDKFIPVAEQAGMINELGHFIIDESLRQIAEIQQQTRQSFSLSINVSVLQLAEAEFSRILLEKISQNGIGNVHIALEITENLLIEDIDRVCSILTVMNDAGVRISLDDFGTGYSSLSILRYLPLDEIKIDKSFVDHVIDDETAMRMVKNIIAIGRNYDVTVLAEGVETRQQFDCLVESGCDFFQGYLFSRPLSAEHLLQYIRKTAERQ